MCFLLSCFISTFLNHYYTSFDQCIWDQMIIVYWKLDMWMPLTNLSYLKQLYVIFMIFDWNIFVPADQIWFIFKKLIPWQKTSHTEHQKSLTLICIISLNFVFLFLIVVFKCFTQSVSFLWKRKDLTSKECTHCLVVKILRNNKQKFICNR